MRRLPVKTRILVDMTDPMVDFEKVEYSILELSKIEVEAGLMASYKGPDGLPCIIFDSRIIEVPDVQSAEEVRKNRTDTMFSESMRRYMNHDKDYQTVAFFRVLKGLLIEHKCDSVWYIHE